MPFISADPPDRPRMAGRFLLAIVAMFLLAQPLPLPAAPAEGEANDSSSYYAFAESLFLEGDYYRAITEYKRFIFQAPAGHPWIEKAHLRIAESFFRGKRWQEAADAAGVLLRRFPDGTLRIDAMFLKATAEREGKSRGQALETLGEILASAAASSVEREKALYQIAMIHLEQGEWSGASAAVGRLSASGPFSAVLPVLRDGIGEIDRLPRKSPALAGTLAAIVPGSGHLYTERPRDALVAFLLNASFLAAAVQLYRHENYAAAGVFLFFELGWYGGNIYSAIGSAHKYNRRVQEEFVLDIRRRSEDTIKSVY